MSAFSRILVVEDDPLLLLDLIDQLSELGYQPVSASSARSAAHLLDGSIEALVTDIDLGRGPNGLVLARLAARLHPGLPIVVVSGGTARDKVDLPSGAMFVPKPYYVAEIVDALAAQRHAEVA